jgi:uncharacterized protein YbcI
VGASQGAKVESSKPGLRIKLVGCRLADVVVVDFSSFEVAAEVVAEVVETNGSYVVVLSATVVVLEEAMDNDSVSPAKADGDTAVEVTDSVSMERIVGDKIVEMADSVSNATVDEMSVVVLSVSLGLVVLEDATELRVEEGLHGEAEVSSYSIKSWSIE